MSGLIFHITKSEAWSEALENGSYTADSLASEGFIHCSLPEQVMAVANTWFRGQEGLLLLCIDSDRVVAPIHYENLEGGQELFPHIYGRLNVEAVIRVLNLAAGPDGSFVMPEDGSAG